MAEKDQQVQYNFREIVAFQKDNKYLRCLVEDVLKEAVAGEDDSREEALAGKVVASESL